MTEEDRAAKAERLESRVGALEEWASAAARSGKVRLSIGDETNAEDEEEWFVSFMPSAAIALGMRLIDAGLSCRGVEVERLAIVINPDKGLFDEEETKPEDLPS